MLLIFPSIEIRLGQCVHCVQGEQGLEQHYSVDPVAMAVLWRGENAKTLHVVDVDGVRDGIIRNRDIIRRMVQAVDIPIQVAGGLRTYEQIKSLLDIGVYRVVLGTAAVATPSLIESLIKEFGARKIVVSLEAKDGKLRTDGGTQDTNISSLEFAFHMKQLGVARLVYADIANDGKSKQLNYDALKELATQTKLRVTAQGGIAGYKDLIRLQELEKFGVDSVIIGRALYENQFPCQHLWRLNENKLTDLGPTRRI